MENLRSVTCSGPHPVTGQLPGPRLRRGSLGPGHLLYHDPGHWVPAGFGVGRSITTARAYPEFHVDRATWQIFTVALERAVVEEVRAPGWPVVVDDRFYCHGAAALVSVELEIPAVTLGTTSINSHVPLEGHLQCRVAFQLVEGTFLKKMRSQKIFNLGRLYIFGLKWENQNPEAHLVPHDSTIYRIRVYVFSPWHVHLAAYWAKIDQYAAIEKDFDLAFLSETCWTPAASTTHSGRRDGVHANTIFARFCRAQCSQFLVEFQSAMSEKERPRLASISKKYKQTERWYQ